MTDTPQSFRQSPIGRFLCAPIELRSYTNLAFLALAFPLGLAYFIFLTVGWSLGVGLLIIWLGIPVLAVVFAGSWLFTKMERGLAIHLLGADVPPMGPAHSEPGLGFWARIRTFLANPVTWKGMAYLAVKFPLGLVTFVAFVTFAALTLSFLLAPFYYAFIPEPAYVGFAYDGGGWVVDTLGEALLCSLLGLGLAIVTFNLFNALAFGWKALARTLLGSQRFAAPPAEPAAAIG